MLLRAEALGRASAHMDAQPERARLLAVQHWSHRRRLRSPDVAGDRRNLLILHRWAAAAPAEGTRPEAARMRAALHAWAAAESVLARAAHRRIRFCVNDLGSPPLTLSWGASHQDVRFPGEPLVPNPFAVSYTHLTLPTKRIV